MAALTPAPAPHPVAIALTNALHAGHAITIHPIGSLGGAAPHNPSPVSLGGLNKLDKGIGHLNRFAL